MPLIRSLCLVQYVIESAIDFPPALMFIPGLLVHISRPAVFMFFDVVTSNDFLHSYLQEWLLEFDFAKIVAAELSRSASDLEKFRNLCALICRCRRSSILANSFLNIQILEVLNQSHRIDMPPPVLDAFWRAILSICERQTAANLAGIFPRAVEIVIESVSIVTEFRVAALEFVTLMMVNDPMVRPSLLSQHFCCNVTRLFLQFPLHTFLQLVLLRFCRAALEIPQLQETVLVEVVEPILRGSTEPDRFLTVIACEIVETVIGIGDKAVMERARKLRSWEAFVSGPFKERGQQLKERYGGKVPSLPAGPWVIPFLDF
jgi:hypothetical protein